MGKTATRNLILALLLALGTSYYYFDLLLPRARTRDASNDMTGRYSYGGDFYPIWLTGGALFLHRTNPYTQQTTRQIQTGLFGRPMDPQRPADPPIEFRAFAYPLYTDLLAAPLLPLGFDAVRAVLGVLLPLLTSASVVLWLRAFRLRFPPGMLPVATILVLVSYPVLEGLFAQQAGLLVGSALALAAFALARGKLLPAGMLLAFASVKPQLIWLLALWLLLWAVSDWKSRRVFALSFVGTMALLFLVSEVILPGWFGDWWNSLVGYSRYTLPPLTQLVLGKVLGNALALGMLALAAAMCWRARRENAGSAGFSLAVSLVLVATVLLAPTGGAVYDQVILLPAIFWLGAHRDAIVNSSLPLRVLALAAMVALAWQWIMACGVAFVSLIVPAWAASAAVLVLPTRMAASLPFVILALLVYFVVRSLRGEYPETKELATTVGSTVP